MVVMVVCFGSQTASIVTGWPLHPLSHMYGGFYSLCIKTSFKEISLCLINSLNIQTKLWGLRFDDRQNTMGQKWSDPKSRTGADKHEIYSDSIGNWSLRRDNMSESWWLDDELQGEVEHRWRRSSNCNAEPMNEWHSCPKCVNEQAGSDKKTNETDGLWLQSNH